MEPHERPPRMKKTTVHYSAENSNGERHNMIVKHVGHITDESALYLADRHAAKRGLAVLKITVIRTGN